MMAAISVKNFAKVFFVFVRDLNTTCRFTVKLYSDDTILAATVAVQILVVSAVPARTADTRQKMP